jgi:hypothetical protein
MAVPRSDRCRSPQCLEGINHPDEHYHQEMRAFLATLNRQQRRLYAGLESNRIGRGGDYVISRIMGICPSTVKSGRRDLADLLMGRPLKERKPSGGRPRVETKHPEIMGALQSILENETAGDPMCERVWVRNGVERLAIQLTEQGFPVCHMTVWRLLKRMGYSMKFNARRRRGSADADHPERDEQFEYIASRRKEFGDRGLPLISVDTKKKELIGNFRSPGRTWCRKPAEVNEHDYSSQAEALAVPFGIYDVKKNTGYVVVGLSHNTAEFAVSSISKWWQDEGQVVYPGAAELLILADGGGGNGYRSRAWRWNLQEMICNPYRLAVTVCHYPPGCSKWNPVEHRLFSQISNNWSGKPLRSLPIMLGYIRGTTTRTGLRVKAVLDEGVYPKGQKVSWKDVDTLNLTPHEVCPEWNYTIRPSP